MPDIRVIPPSVDASATPGAPFVSWAQSLADHFDRSHLTGQFVLSYAGAHIPESWPVRRMGAWQLGTHPALPVCDIISADGVLLGWFVGWVVATSGRLVGERVVSRLTSFSPPADLEAFVYRHGGRFIAVFALPHLTRVYLDPMGSLGAVYSPAHGMLASTTSLIPYTLGCDDDNELIAELGVPRRNGMFPFGLTPRRGVLRLLPNHTLDMNTWGVVRHWPGGSLDEDVDPARSVRVVADRVKRVVDAVAFDRPLYASLTAGHDSRMLAACTRAAGTRVRFLTIQLPDKMAELDCEVASALAKRLGLDHEVIPFRAASKAELDEWLWRTGCMVGEHRGLQATATYHRLDPLRAELTGQGGALSRAAHWRSGMRPRNVNTAELLDSYDIPATPRMLACAEDWLDALPTHDVIHVYDLAHIELWLGCRGSLLPYGDATAVAYRIYPLSHRDVLEHLIRLPRSYKLAANFPRDLMHAEWPDLLSVPINRTPGARHYVQSARRRVWLARRAMARRGINL